MPDAGSARGLRGEHGLQPAKHPVADGTAIVGLAVSYFALSRGHLPDFDQAEPGKVLVMAS